MNLALILACGGLATATIAVVVLVAVFDWADAPRAERLALTAIAAGMVWAAPARFAAGGVGLGDAVLLAGILSLVLLTYGRRLARHADQLADAAEFAGQLPPARRTGVVKLLVAWASPEAIEAGLRTRRH